MKAIKNLILAFLAVMTFSCNNEKSLQEYYVENQRDSDFLALDVPTSMFTNMESIDSSQTSTLKTIKKINLLALEKSNNVKRYEEEKLKLDEIFVNEKYQLLMKFGGSDKKAALYFTGEEDAIDELIAYGYDDEKGLGVARVLGEDMEPEKILKMIQSLKAEDLDTEGIKGMMDIFVDSSIIKNKPAKKEMEVKTDTL